METEFGWTGKILKIDLTDRKVSCLDTHEYSGHFIGGLGIGEKIYWDESSPDTGAFDPDNPLILMTGPLCATTAPSAPRLVVCGKSPATCPERFVNASIAGFFPAELMDEYYELRGWDVKTGFLKKETLERLDLTDVIKPLGERVL